MNEIEVKARVKDLAKLQKQLEKLNCVFSEPLVQEDEIFTPKELDTYPVPRGMNALRIRKQNSTYLLTLKQPRANELDNIEKELGIDNPNQMRDICLLLGFKPFSKVKKLRRKAKYKGYEICLDEVEGLGSFIEVETFSDKPGNKVQEEMFAFLQSLGIKKEDQETHGYDILLKLNEKRNPRT